MTNGSVAKPHAYRRHCQAQRRTDVCTAPGKRTRQHTTDQESDHDTANVRDLVRFRLGKPGHKVVEDEKPSRFCNARSRFAWHHSALNQQISEESAKHSKDCARSSGAHHERMEVKAGDVSADSGKQIQQGKTQVAEESLGEGAHLQEHVHVDCNMQDSEVGNKQAVNNRHH